MRVLITGGMGFAGTHLAKHLVECRDDVAVTYLPNKENKSDAELNTKSNLLQQLEASRKSYLPKQVQQVALDVTNVDHLEQILTLMKPDVIYHLAGVSYVPSGEKNADLVHKINTQGTCFLLEAVKKCCPKSRVLVVSSAQVYGMPRVTGQPFVETSEIRPTSNYAVSKACAEMYCHKYVSVDGVQAVIVRPFAHVGPFQEDTFSLSSFAKQVALVKLGRKEPILEVGNIEVKRDFCDVSDIVRGYRECALNGRIGEVYNLCSGNSYLLKDLIDILIKLSGVPIEIKIDEDRLRSVDVPEVFGSYQKVLKEFGWRPRVEAEAFLGGLFTYWLEFLNK